MLKFDRDRGEVRSQPTHLFILPSNWAVRRHLGNLGKIKPSNLDVTLFLSSYIVFLPTTNSEVEGTEVRTGARRY